MSQVEVHVTRRRPEPDAPGAWRLQAMRSSQIIEGVQLGQTAARGAVAQHDMCTPVQLSQVRGVVESQVSRHHLNYTRRISNMLYIMSYGCSTAPARRRAQTMSQCTRETPHHIHRPSQAQTTVLQTAVKARASGSQGIAKVPKSTGMDPAKSAGHIALPCDRARFVGHIEEERVTQLLDANQ